VNVVVLVVGIVLLIGALVALAVAHRVATRAKEEVARAHADAATRVASVEEHHDRLTSVLDNVVEGVVVVDAEGRELVRNASAMRFRDARHSDAVAEELVDRLLRLALEEKADEHELPLFGPPREVLLVRALPLHVEERLVGAVAFVHDVTELRRAESVRRDFVANVSHELKTPIGALALLAETIAASDDPTVVHGLAEQVLREADRLARIVDDLLDLSIIEAQEALTREAVPLRLLLEEAVERIRPLALAQGIPLHGSVPPEDVAVACDPTQVVSAVTNLLDNAVKYSDEGAPVELGAWRDSDRAVIEVRDHGIGVPTKDLERIFERFYRVDKARSRATGGTGLGLSIVRHVAQVHGGDVSVESREGEGSTFRLVLPLAERTGSTSGVREAS
jgi:two-component system, OmpR family, sensor histidine kinase SenX3